ncbi:thioredoxin domain-containing protein 11 isoform C [Patagioenas fasciata monilis]|uniref:Thioredoxin domain-containing protein 11 isoform A n=1 Tax=Patagioenas fasciata monilis TaxID=372326 RepID=A0A1V4K6D4_PATFA|nr:thioredoxin domain-containing protein 11 isoform A [Patagioenas fasciata monilis]OPJ79419.1 thioredoxin domain-containing protein 11 isoform C [Patagioenas fasciata monilis]
MHQDGSAGQTGAPIPTYVLGAEEQESRCYVPNVRGCELAETLAPSVHGGEDIEENHVPEPAGNPRETDHETEQKTFPRANSHTAPVSDEEKETMAATGMPERLGASRSAHLKEFAAIVDLKEEVHYVLDQNQPLVGSTLENFIKNFSALYSPLERHLVDEPWVRVPDQRVITEVTTNTFRHTVVLSEKNVLLLYYAQWCGFCASLNHIFIQLARLLPPDNFTVARIDITRNDLPWEFMTDRLPTILFFPHQRKEQSVKFPEDFSINLPNLLKFILHHSSFSSSEPCTKECLQKETVLQQGRISHLEREIQKLRSEIGALHQAQEQLEAQLSEARREEQKLQQQKHALEKQHKTLQLHSEQLQATHDRKNRELLEMAEKLQELADASENLLKENTLLRILVASREGKLQSKDEIKEFLQSEQTLSEDNAVSVSAATATLEEKRIDNINTTETEHSSGNRTE